MHILFSNMLNVEVSRLPNILRIGSYYVYFWMNENHEPVHVHVNEGSPDVKFHKALADQGWWLYSCK